MYDHVYRLDILWRAWKEVRKDKGSAGIDGITFEMIEEYGVEEYLMDIQEDLVNGKYKPLPIKRVYIPKPDAKQATEKVKQALHKNWYVVDADIQGYFDNINHEILLSLLKRRILKLCRLWLQAGVIENGKYSKTGIAPPRGSN